MSDTTAPKTAPDWERIELDYRAGLLTLREIGEQHGVSHTAIKKRADKQGWSRDLSAKIKAKAEEKVSKAMVSSQVSSEQAETKKAGEQAMVEAGAEAIFRIRMEHRQDIAVTRKLFQTLLSEVQGVTDAPELAEQLFELLHEPQASADDPKAVAREEDRLHKLRQAFERIMSIGGRVDAAKKLTEMLEKLVKVERQAFGLDDGDKPEEPSTPDSTPTNEIARRVAFILQQGMRAQKG